MSEARAGRRSGNALGAAWIRLATCLACGLAMCLQPAPARTQQVEMSSTLNPVGSGARATGMGGAFIGVADDATAASWNPAGLIQLEKPEVSIVHSYFKRTQQYHSDEHPEIEGENDMDAGGVNYASAALPFTVLKKNVVVSLNYQRLYEMNKDVAFDYTWDLEGGDSLDDAIQFSQKGYLYTLSPAAAVMITPRFQLGATLNFWGDYVGDNGWENSYTSHGTGTIFGLPYQTSVDQQTSVSFRGVNAHVGLLWTVAAPLTVGVVYKSPFAAKLEKETTTTIIGDAPGLGYHEESREERSEDLTMEMPASYGVGLSYRHSDAWTVSLDVYRTQWSKFLIRDSKGNETNPLNSRPIDEGRLGDTTQVRAGTEYLVIRPGFVVPLRCGAFYDPEPVTEGTDDYYGFSLGTGYIHRMFSLDASYQYRFGNDTAGDIPGVKGSSADVRQHTVMLSLIWYFD